MTVKSVLHELADMFNKSEWHDSIEAEEAKDEPRQVDNDEEKGAEFSGTVKPASLGGGSSKDGDNTDGNS